METEMEAKRAELAPPWRGYSNESDREQELKGT